MPHTFLTTIALSLFQASSWPASLKMYVIETPVISTSNLPQAFHRPLVLIGHSYGARLITKVRRFALVMTTMLIKCTVRRKV